ncbi:hypothetical protein TRFO_07692 [Tritrichomonas foetus]|uniref:Uncharacterized protein n=1 Tax=Tritrichomonas foetus TaxID=1144522 RepID=A0A1J4JU26_9EUKA|nr:hypothetical protein TRFO_07692 [Tritrichomonas foetus]|eukprot:OHT01022.1 hypothetical protein TRFO_07692 [Tritrichomonas foetus]
MFNHDENEKNISENTNLDHSTISSMLLIAKNINSNPPQLIDFCDGSQALQTICTHFNKLVEQNGLVKYDKKNREDLDLIFRTFVSEVVRLVKGKEKINDSQMHLSELSSSHDKYLDTFEKLADAKSSIKKLEDQIDDEDLNTKTELKMKIKKLNNTIDSIIKDSAKNSRKADQIQRECDNSVFEIQKKYDRLCNKAREINDERKVLKYAKTRLESQINSNKEEIGSLKLEIHELKTKLVIKTDEIEVLKAQNIESEMHAQNLLTDNQKLAIVVNDYKSKYEKSKLAIKQLDPRIIADIENDKKNLQSSVKILTDTLDNTSEELIQSMNHYNNSINLVHKMVQMINSMDEKLNIQKSMIDRLSQEKINLMKSRDDLFHDFNKIQDKNSIIDQIKQNMFPEFNGDDKEIPSLLNEMINNQNNLMKNQNKRLFTMIENLTKFLVNLISSNQIDYLLLRQNDDDSNLNDDNNFKDQILLEAARIRQYMSQNSLDLENDDQILDLSKICKDRELFNVLSSQIVVNRIIQKHSESLELHDSKQAVIMNEISQVLEYQGDYERLPEYIQNIKSIIDNIIEETKAKNIHHLKKTMIYKMNILNDFDSNLRELLNYEEDLIHLPHFVCEYIKDIEKRTYEERHHIQYSYQSQIKQLQTQFNEEKVKAINYIKSLEAENKQFKEKLNLISKEKIELEKEFNNMKEKALHSVKTEQINHDESHNKLNELLNCYNDLQNDANRLRSENKELINKLDETQKLSDVRINEMINQMNEQHKQELDAIKESKASQEEKLNDDSKKLKDKYKKLKVNFKQVMSTYVDAFNKQKNMITTLKLKNDELSKNSITNLNEKNTDNHFQIENLKLQATNKSLSSEKQSLLTKITQLNEKINQIQQARDIYWESQIAVKENEFKKRIFVSEQALNDFTHNIITQISTYIPKPIEISQQFAQKGIATLMTKIENNENLISEMQRELLKIHKSDAYLEERYNAWEKWGRFTYESIIGSKAQKNSQDLRYALGEIMLSTINQRNIFNKLESLRIQKKIMLKNDIFERIDQDISLSSIIILILAVKKMTPLKSFSLPLIKSENTQK